MNEGDRVDAYFCNHGPYHGTVESNMGDRVRVKVSGPKGEMAVEVPTTWCRPRGEEEWRVDMPG